MAGIMKDGGGADRHENHQKCDMNTGQFARNKEYWNMIVVCIKCVQSLMKQLINENEVNNCNYST
jgi:hypothetical protein